MPTSVYYQIPIILEIVIALDPDTILDIGAGTGKYGFLIREYLEIWGAGANAEPYGKQHWKRRIDAIEAFEPYLTPVHEYVYDHIYVGDAAQLVPQIEEQYDLILLIDVLEHLEKSIGECLLRHLLQKSRSILLSVPSKLGRQPDLWGNPFEVHRSQWTEKDLKDIAPCRFIKKTTKLICIMGVHGVDRWRIYQTKKKRDYIRKHFPTIAKVYSQFVIRRREVMGNDK
jgi:2-polyprenyl-3-methyl-5-hydroxy-6-metoxy-1,4-benzoquinol methylase